MSAFLQAELPTLLMIFTCLFLSAIFACAETAITSIGTLKAKHIMDVRGKEAASLQLWLTHPERVITVLLAFNIVVNILATALTTELTQKYFVNNAVSIATGLSTFFVLIFGEILPKSFGKAYAEQLAVPMMRLIGVIYKATSPVVIVLSEMANFGVKKLSKGRKTRPLITEEEIEFLVSEGEKAGVIKDLKKDIIESAFDFDETRVKEIMTPRTELNTLEASTSLEEVLQVIIKTGHSRIPIYNDTIDRIVGVVLAKDILQRMSQKNYDHLKAKDIMREALFAPESKTIMEVFKDLKRTRCHLAIIIDEYGGTAGIVTMEDILEEIVGEIQDEFDAEQAKILPLQSGVFEVSGSINVEDFLDFFKLKDSDVSTAGSDIQEAMDDIDTLAGLVTHLVGQMPSKGQSVTLGPLTIEVLVVAHHRIKSLKVTDLNHQSDSQNAGLT